MAGKGLSGFDAELVADAGGNVVAEPVGRLDRPLVAELIRTIVRAQSIGVLWLSAIPVGWGLHVVV